MRAPRTRNLLLALAAAMTVAGGALAYWTTTSSPSNASAGTLTLAAPTNLTLPSSPAASTTVPVSWTAPTPPAAGSPTYLVERSANGGSTWTTASGTCPSASGTLTATTCSDTAPADGPYVYRVRAYWRSWTSLSATSSSLLVDTTAPQTTATGADSNWHNAAVVVALSAIDPGYSSSPRTGSGVATLHYTVDAGTRVDVAGASGTAGTNVTVSAPIDHSNDGTHTITYWSTDAAGNNESSHSVTVKIDTTAPAPAISSPANNGFLLNSPATITGTGGTASTDSTTVSVTVYNGTGTGGTVFQAATSAAVSSSTGQWSLTTGTALTAGNTYTVQVVQTDSAGNSGSVTSTFKASTVTLSTASNGYVNSTTPTMAGTASSNTASSVSVTVYNGSCTTATCGTGSFTSVKAYSAVTPTGASSPYSWTDAWPGTGSLTAGSTYTAVASQGTSSVANTFVVDTTAPTVTLTAPAGGTSTNNTTPTFSGTAGTAATDSTTVTVKVYSGSCTTFCGTFVNPTVQTLTATRSGGSWSVQAATLANGQYTVQASQSDAAGNTGTSSFVTFTVDTTPPTVSSINRASATPTNATSVSWTVTFSESVTGVDTSDFRVATTGTVGSPTVTSVTGSGSSYTVTVGSISSTGTGTVGLNLVDDDSVKDNAGNVLGGAGGAGTSGDGSYTGQTYTVDTTAPAAPAITSPANNAWSTATVTLSGTAEASSTVQLYDGGTATGTTATADGAGNWTKQLTAVAVGSHTYTAKATDAAGNTSAASASVIVQVETTAPTVPTTVIAKTEGLPNSTAGSIRQGGTYFVYANASDTGGSGLSTVTADVSAISGAGNTSVALHSCTSNCTVNGTTYGWVSNQQTASNPLTAGTATYVVTATDGAGNQGNSGTGGSAKTVTVNNTAPAVSTIATANKTGGTAGLIEAGDTITFTYNAPVDGISLLSSWYYNWTTAANVQVRIVDGGASTDTMEIRTTDGVTLLPFGTIDLGNTGYVTGGAGKYVNFGTTTTQSTIVRSATSPNPFTVTFGAKDTTTSTGTLSSTAVSGTGAVTITWSPGASSTVYDVAGNLLSNSPSSVTNTGAGNPKTQF